MASLLKWATVAAVLATISAVLETMAAELPLDRPQLRHVFLNGAHLVELSEQRYMLINPPVWAGQELIMSSVDVFGENMYAHRPGRIGIDVERREKAQMSAIEEQLVKQMRERIIQVDTNPASLGIQDCYFSIRYSQGKEPAQVLTCQGCYPEELDMGSKRVMLYGCKSQVGFSSQTKQNNNIGELVLVAGGVSVTAVWPGNWLLHDFLADMSIEQARQVVEPEFKAMQQLAEQKEISRLRSVHRLHERIRETLRRAHSQLKGLVGVVREVELDNEH